MAEPIKDYEDLSDYGLDPESEERLIEAQDECTFCWTTAGGAPMAVIMSYLRRDGRFWLTASAHRKRIPAIRRDGRVAIVITSTGTDLGPNKTVTYQGTARVLEDQATKEWFYPALAERLMGRWGPERVAEFARFLDSPQRVVIEVTPALRVGYDGDKMARATVEARRSGLSRDRTAGDR